MIKNVVIHMQGDQPLLADVEALPAAGDASLVCTNLRTNAGKRPTFIDHVDSWFLIPLLHVRFIEIPKSAMGGGLEEETPTETAIVPVEDDELEVDEEFLRKIREA